MFAANSKEPVPDAAKARWEILKLAFLNSKYFSLNSSYPELILIGIKDYNFKDILRLRDISEKNKIGLDLMKIGQASGTFNFLTLEKRDFITIFI